MEYRRGIEGMMASSATPPGSSQVSPKGSPKNNRIKFLCSHGGKILPRPTDGHLKYVGGETRVISVPRDVNFPTLMKKLTYLVEGEMILKYQLMPEDLDALVSVKSDEDLRHMFDEYDRHESQGTPRLRAFLFPANPVIIDNPMEPHALEQRYLDAINGIVRPTTTTINGHHGYKPGSTTNHTSYSMSSACSSPRSPESYTGEALSQEALLQLQTYQNAKLPQIQKVHSSPNLYNLNPQHQLPAQPQTPLQGHHQVQQQHHHHYYQTYKQQQQQQQANHHHHHQHHSYQSNKPPLDPHPHKGVGVGGLVDKCRLSGRPESLRYHHVDQASQYYYSTPKHSKGCSPAGGCCNKCRHYDEYSASTDRRIDRAESLPPAPHPQSPGQAGFVTVKGWDSAI